MFHLFFRPLDITNLIRTFPPLVWLLLALTFLATLAVVTAAHEVYLRFPEDVRVESGLTPGDIMIRMVATLTEPDSVDFFSSWCAGVGLTRFSLKPHNSMVKVIKASLAQRQSTGQPGVVSSILTGGIVGSV